MKDISSAHYDAMTRSACFVCRIVEGRPLFPNPRVVYDDERVIAFLNQFPSQEGYAIVCPKRHAERFETDLSADEWLHLQRAVQQVARAVATVTGAIRMYIASLGSPERNAQVHIHVCPCPAGTPFEEQQFAAMDLRGRPFLALSNARLNELAESIRSAIGAG